MVVPVVVVGNVHLVVFAAEAQQIALSVVPEVIVGEGYIV